MGDESGGLKESDLVIIPNVFAIGGYQVAQSNIIKKAFFTGAISSTNSKVYKHIRVDDFLWGYEDDLIKSLAKWGVEPFGMFKTVSELNPNIDENLSKN